jgi:hypothetical protein
VTLNETKKGHSIPGFAVAHPMILRRSRLRGLPWYGWHGFRRDIASNLYELGANEKIVRRVLRHAKPHIAKTATSRPLIRRCWKAQRMHAVVNGLGRQWPAAELKGMW